MGAKPSTTAAEMVGGTPSAQHATLVRYKWSRDDAANYLSDSGLLSILVSAVNIITLVKLQPYADLRNNCTAKAKAHKQICTKVCKSVSLDFGIGLKPSPKSKMTFGTLELA